MLRKSKFLLNDEFYFFNNGSYGACPKEVFEEYQKIQRRLEFQPIDFFQKDLLPALKKSRKAIGDFINSKPQNLVIIRNATYSANLIIRSLELDKNDEIILTNQEYGACVNAWKFWQQEKGFKIKSVEIDLPLPDTKTILMKIRSKISKKTKAIFFSHISSLTAQLFPAEEICNLARKYNVLSIIDGAHAVGQINLNMKKINADFYFSNIHKWLFAPKGTAFLYTDPRVQKIVKPLITGWGWGENRELLSGFDYVDFNQFYGTDDLSSFLTIEKAVDFFKKNKIKVLNQECNQLVKYFIREINKLTGFDSLYKNHPHELQMGVVEIPSNINIDELKELLYNKFRIEVPVIAWNGKNMIRISVQVFNNKKDVDYFIASLKEIFG